MASWMDGNTVGWMKILLDENWTYMLVEGCS
jgi:hypothetical protein